MDVLFESTKWKCPGCRDMVDGRESVCPSRNCGTKRPEMVGPHEPSPFAVGDTVRLKSGGPAMCVSVVHPNRITAMWFPNSGNPLHIADFPAGPYIAEFPAACIVRLTER